MRWATLSLLLLIGCTSQPAADTFVPGVPEDHVAVFDRMAAEFPSSFQDASGITEEQSAANETRRVTLWGPGLNLDPGPQQIGDCVSWGMAHALQCRLWVASRGKPAKDVSTLYTYGITRVTVGRKRPPCGQDGAYPSHAADGVSRYGWLLINEGSLPHYSGSQATRFGCNGPAPAQIAEGRKRAGGSVQPIGDIKALRNAICAGYPCTYAISWNPGKTYTVAGRKCLQFSGRSQGGHQVCLIGYDGSVPGKTFFYLMNSHGVTFAGGAQGDDPPGGVWVEGSVIQKQIDAGAEIWAVSDLPGFSAEPLDLSIFDSIQTEEK